jgi:hypothetical protein
MFRTEMSFVLFLSQTLFYQFYIFFPTNFIIRLLNLGISNDMTVKFWKASWWAMTCNSLWCTRASFRVIVYILWNHHCSWGTNVRGGPMFVGDQCSWVSFTDELKSPGTYQIYINITLITWFISYPRNKVPTNQQNFGYPWPLTPTN